MKTTRNKNSCILSVFLLCSFIIYSGCTIFPQSKEKIDIGGFSTMRSSKKERTSGISEEITKIVKILQADQQKFTLELEANETVNELIKRLPLSLELKDLNKNEKYVYLEQPLPSSATEIQHIEKGDVLLFGSDCLVIFYESFETDYSYTRIGKIKEQDSLEPFSSTGSLEAYLE